MNLDSNTQDKFYAQYRRKIEENFSMDSKDLEMFFRMHLAIRIYTLVPKNSVYRSFVDWVENKKIITDVLFKELLDYAKVYNTVNNAPLHRWTRHYVCRLPISEKQNRICRFSL